MSFSTGQRIGNYVLQDRLGGGGMGVVWRAWDSKENRQVALKAVADQNVNIAEFEERFRNEARRHSKLKHPNIVQVLATFRAGDVYCMVMELIEGMSLDALIASSPGNRVDLALACRIMSELLTALNYAHMQGIWHRDVKPSNILLDRENHVHLADFGIALAIGENRLTRAGIPVGTAAYMSPEQIQTPQQIDYRTDVYSAGCVFYEMLTGRPPFVAPNDGKSDPEFVLQSAHIKQQPLPPVQLNPAIPPHINALILTALEKDRNRRIPGCGEFLRRLQYTSGTDGAAVATTESKTRTAWLVAGIAVVAVAVGLLTVALL